MTRLLAWAFLIGGLSLLLYDWWLGQSRGSQRRERIKSRIGDFWAWAEDTDWRGFAAREATYVLSLFSRVLGTQILSVRFVGLSATASILISVVSFVILRMIIGFPFNAPDIGMASVLITPYLVVNALFDVACLVITIYLLRIIARSSGMQVLILAIIADLGLLYTLACLTYWVGTDWTLAAPISDQPSLRNILGALGALNIEKAPSYFMYLLHTIVSFHEQLGQNMAKFVDLYKMGLYKRVIISSEIVFIVLFTSSIPTIIHMLVLAIFVVSRVFPDQIKSIVGKTAAAFYESAKSPITICGGACVVVSGVLFQAA